MPVERRRRAIIVATDNHTAGDNQSNDTESGHIQRKSTYLDVLIGEYKFKYAQR